jgi:hypothetical protein
MASCLLLSLHAEEGTAAAASDGSAAPGLPPATQPQAQVAAPGALPPGLSVAQENPFRRFEIIAFGSFPITLLYTNIAFQVTHYVQSGFDSRWAPWPFTGEYTDSITDSERFTRMGVAAGISLAVAGLDALIRHARAKKAARLATPLPPAAAPAPAPAAPAATAPLPSPSP